jgi:uncharacterized membrane protein YfcA
MHSLTVWQALAMFGAGLLAGTINAIVGSGSLITFPVLLGLGLSPLVANVSNNVGLMLGNASGVHGYRRELRGQLERVLSIGPWSAAGGLTGAALLLLRPSSFRTIVPFLVLLAVAMVIAQPTVSKKLAQRGPRPETGGYLFRIGVFLTGIYGGYFGAAQGVILIALLAICLDDELQRLNALKNVCAFLVNGIAGILFIIRAPVNWSAAILIAIGSIIGGQIGASYGRRLPAKVLRAIIIGGGTSVAIYLLTT